VLQVAKRGCAHLMTISERAVSRQHTTVFALVLERLRYWYRLHFRRPNSKRNIMCQAAERRFDLVTTDVDGTLLSTKNELSPRNEEAIAECIKLGIPVCIGAQLQTLCIIFASLA